MNRILIANRGEIAVRLLRSCKELGMETVIVYSDGDSDTLAVQLADKSYCIGPSSAQHSYLNADIILNAAKISKSEAIHPGYGFLAENPKFVELCQKENIQFIGPSHDVMQLMGDKIKARNIVSNIGVSIIEGSENPVKKISEVYKIADRIGYPLLLKAAAGGGGKGMRIVNSSDEVQLAFSMAQKEATAAFGNGDLYVERFIQNARHIEVQVLADTFGNVIHLGERDCSIQRRHQKLVEESLCTFIPIHVREELYEAAVRICRETGYDNAGTIEFLVDMDQNQFYFIEMNARLQVEHPVTEMITGVDIVAEQIRISASEPLSIKQEDVEFNGHAIECRINAEDSTRNFRPSPGEITSFIPPGGPNVRTDTHGFSGYTLPPFYDSLLAKLIVLGTDREHAIKKMKAALKAFQITGVETTIPFHIKLMGMKEFQEGSYNTQWLEKLLQGSEF